METTVWVYGGDERTHPGRYLSRWGMQEYSNKGHQGIFFNHYYYILYF